ncbi:MAG: hypothetical protein HPY90_10080 [Syntrophothermus sp.]|uniref:hypothetical protein n=1 Tax=Syntrophothermus sp. TaxID=2736299 RepID=UPI00257F46BF|nr:hypothetical protein [Syntrophothermus sp.]NSW83599.1 hypothetical protein [Syntrophothermus sp.]
MTFESEDDVSEMRKNILEALDVLKHWDLLHPTRFFLAGWALTRAFRPLLEVPTLSDLVAMGPAPVEKAMEEFHQLILSSLPPVHRGKGQIVAERPCPLGKLYRKMLDDIAVEHEWPSGVMYRLLKDERFLFWQEAYVFVSTVKKWLTGPRPGLAAVERPSELWKLLSVPMFYYESRLRQAAIIPHLISKGKGILVAYEVLLAEGIMPLVWVELAMALQWGIPATFCPECRGLMVRGREKTCGDPRCLRKHREKRLAALENSYRKSKGLPVIEDVTEAARAYNRRKKRESRGAREP